MFASPVRNAFDQTHLSPRMTREFPLMSVGSKPTRSAGPMLNGRSLEWASK